MHLPKLLLPFLLFLPSLALGQELRPGFDPGEYQELLKVLSSWHGGPGRIGGSDRFHRVYRSPEMGLDNMWELHADTAGVAVLAIRGTTRSAVSWLENAYAAMTPAQGSLRLEDDLLFEYRLAEDPKASVHIGWLVGMAYLQQDMLPRIDSITARGVKDLLIIGHSQGGGIAYLLTAHLSHLRDTGRLPADLRVKTYCSAAPKPGDLYFAYDYEYRTRGGWAFNVVNALDWVPEVPISVQTTNDMNRVNPFAGSRGMIRKQPLVKRLILNRIYSQLDRPAKRVQRRYEKYLGRVVGKQVRKHLPEYDPAEFASTANYVRTGTTIVLRPGQDYLDRYPEDPQRVFVHHMLEAYYFLAGRYELRPEPERTERTR